MSSNEASIRAFYSDASREDRRLAASRAGFLEFHYTIGLAGEYINHDTSVVEIGCGTGYYGVRLADKCKEYVGIDLSPECIAAFNREIRSCQLSNVKAIVGDAVRLDEIENCRFDVVMALGPMYHLPPDERDLVFSECKRICRDGGIIIFAYANKVGAYVRGCLEFPGKYPDKQLSHSVLVEGMSDEMPGLFYMTMPEEMEAQAKLNGLSVLRHAGVDFVFDEKSINAMNDEQFEAWMDICDYMSDSPTCSGLSNHAIMICQK